MTNALGIPVVVDDTLPEGIIKFQGSHGEVILSTGTGSIYSPLYTGDTGFRSIHGCSACGMQGSRHCSLCTMCS